MNSKNKFVISKTAIKLIILPMAIFGYQQFVLGNMWPAAGAATLIVATGAYELRYDLKQVPFDPEGLENAARRIGEAESDLADAINNVRNNGS